MLRCVVVLCGLLGAQAAVLPPRWASRDINPCAARPGGWQLLHWPADGRCYRIFEQGPCPDTMELAPRRNGTAECRCPPGTAQSPRDALCHMLFSRGPCLLGEYFAPVPARYGNMHVCMHTHVEMGKGGRREKGRGRSKKGGEHRRRRISREEGGRMVKGGEGRIVSVEGEGVGRGRIDRRRGRKGDGGREIAGEAREGERRVQVEVGGEGEKDRGGNWEGKDGGEAGRGRGSGAGGRGKVEGRGEGREERGREERGGGGGGGRGDEGRDRLTHTLISIHL
ncbi:hypothetical protein PR048_033179 [Dryococelus australis]|uniref:DUF4789 domain-containing protein n=1 Tax=Dryococelus australis TaxID=614101 RepID=A0ABQ9FZI4_9NEOP|nr:hypothetical protein PR048_033179 [Dryococelus australis]